MIKQIIRFTLFSALLITSSLSVTEQTSSARANLVFICHKGLHYSRSEVQFAFKAYLDAPRPVDNRALYADMLDFIGYTPERYRKIWNKMFFRRGVFIPKMLDEAGAISWVAASEDGVGYVSEAPKNNPNIEVCGVN